MILMACLLVTAGVIVWQKNFYLSPQEVTQKKLDEIFKENEKESEKDRKNLAAHFMKQIQETQLACALADPTEHQDTFFENSMEGLRKIDYEVTAVSKTGDTAEVSVRMNYFELQKIVENGQEIFQEELKENDSLFTEEMMEKLYGVIAEEFQKGPSDDEKTVVTVLLHKKNHQWVMEDSFVDKIFAAVLQQ